MKKNFKLADPFLSPSYATADFVTNIVFFTCQLVQIKVSPYTILPKCDSPYRASCNTLFAGSYPIVGKVINMYYSSLSAGFPSYWGIIILYVGAAVGAGNPEIHNQNKNNGKKSGYDISTKKSGYQMSTKKKSG
jgi:hypothetical protein